MWWMCCDSACKSRHWLQVAAFIVMRKSLLLLLSGALAVSPTVMGDVIGASTLLNRVESHPAVVEKKNQALLKGLRIRELVAEDGLQINLSTKSKLSIIGEYGDSAQRVSDRDRSYIDGVVTAQKTLYDFGATEFGINSEISREKAAQLEYVGTYEQTMQTLLSLAVEVARLDHLIASLGQTISTARDAIADLELRFSSGVGTLVDVRKAQLLLLDLETEKENLQRERSLKMSALEQEFDLAAADQPLLQQTLARLFDTIDRTEGGSESLLMKRRVNSPRSTDRINLEKAAIRYEIKSLKAEKYPQLTGSLTGVLYDVTRGPGEYELYGGINVAVPLYDSGLRNSRELSLHHQLQLQDDSLVVLKNRKRLDALDLDKRYQQLSLQYRTAREKSENLRERLSQITHKITMTGEGLLPKLQTTIELDNAERAISAYPHQLRSLTIDHLVLNEQLLDRMSIAPSPDNKP